MAPVTRDRVSRWDQRTKKHPGGSNNVLYERGRVSTAKQVIIPIVDRLAWNVHRTLVSVGRSLYPLNPGEAGADRPPSRSIAECQEM
jgi:hypothetical protein